MHQPSSRKMCERDTPTHRRDSEMSLWLRYAPPHNTPKGRQPRHASQLTNGNDHDATRSRPHEVSLRFISFFPLSWSKNSWLLRAKVLTSTLELTNLYNESTSFPHPHLRKDQPSGLLDPVKLQSASWDTSHRVYDRGLTLASTMRFELTRAYPNGFHPDF